MRSLRSLRMHALQRTAADGAALRGGASRRNWWERL